MTTLTNTINEMAAALEMNAIDLFKSIETNNMLHEDDQIETEDEIRSYLVSVAYNSRMSAKGKEKYSKVCKINDAYFKAKLAA